MATVQELSGLHQRYLALSNRFKAVWTFHQFLQGLSKILAEDGSATPSTSFQALYGELKSLAKDLNSDDTAAVARRLDDTASRLDEKTTELIEQDGAISPSRLRQFFDRVRSYDRRILIQLLRAYLYVRQQRGWYDDLVDKADFLVTRLADELAEEDRPAIERDPRTSRRDVWRSLWLVLGVDDPTPERVEDTVMEVRTLREAMTQAKSLDQFNELGLIDGYRRLKHSLGDVFFYPPVLEEITRTNIYLKNSIGDFFQREERRIAGEYRQVFELEREALQLDTGMHAVLNAELQDFRGEVQKFESQRERKELRLDEVARLRARARDLIPKLQVAGDGATAGASDADAEAPGAAAQASVASAAPPPAAPLTPPPVPRAVVALPTPIPMTRSATLRVRTAHAELLGDALRRVLAFLERTSWNDHPEVVAALPDLSALRLEPREIVAFRRLHDPTEMHLELEQFLLEAAALRIRVTAQAEEIVAQRGGFQTETDPQTSAAAGRVLCHLAGQFERRLDLFVQEAVQSGDAVEARALQHLRMRVLREYAGLWLLVCA